MLKFHALFRIAKKTQSEGAAREGKIVERPKNYTIDAEIGRLKVDIFEIRSHSQKVWSSRKEIFPETCSREAFKTPCFRELVVFFPSDEPFRKSTEKINRVLWRNEEDAIQFRTVANIVEREGELIQEHLSEKAKNILKAHDFSAEGRLLDQNKVVFHIKEDRGWTTNNNNSEDTIPKPHVLNEDGDLLEQNTKDDNSVDIAEDTILQVLEELNVGKEKDFQIDLSEIHQTFEDPRSVKANISLDDVLAKKQKESGRKKGSLPKEKREMVKNTIAHIQSDITNKYILNADSIAHMMILLLAFLLNNGLLSGTGQFVFFLDGASDLRLAVQSFFDFVPFKMILDWYHLEKKCKERLSMGMKGKQAKKKALEYITALLWRGKVDMAIIYLRSLNENVVKNQEEIERLIGYFERNRSFIPCYALRQKLGLRISSNLVEKANDLVVSDRQKHNGMSWSTLGSKSLATITSVHLNDEHMHWLLKRDITFQFKKPEANLAA